MSRRPRPTRVVGALALASFTACSGSSSTVPGGDAHTVQLSQSSVSFTSLLATAQLAATVRDAGGNVISATVTWTTDASSIATVSGQGLVTAVGNGSTRVIATAGTTADTAIVTVQQVPAQLTLAPDTLVLASVDDTATIVATVRDAGGSPVSGVPVTFIAENEAVASVDASGRVTAHAHGGTRIYVEAGETLSRRVLAVVSGFLPPAYLVGGYLSDLYIDEIPAVIGADGFWYDVTSGALPAGLTLTSRTISGVPSEPGVHFFEVTATNGTLTVSERYAITISAADEGDFNLWIAYNGGPMPPQHARTALTNAVARWEEIIDDDTGQTVTFPTNLFTPNGACSGLVDGTLFNGATIDDVAILVAVVPVDGLGETLAVAGPCGFTRPPPLPVILQGQMRIDRADAEDGTASFLEDVVVHEIAHVLGIGTLWQDSTVAVGTPDVRYFGVNAKTEWIALGGVGNVPLEPEIGAHWDEAWFDHEIMTPFAEHPGILNPLSRVTIGALKDFGWPVDLGAADAYALPGCRPLCTSAPPRAPGRRAAAPPTDIVIEPLHPLPPGVRLY